MPIKTTRRKFVLISAAALLSGCSTSSPRGSSMEPSRLEQEVQGQHIIGFSRKGTAAIKKALALVSTEYLLPNILFYHPENGSRIGRSLGLVKDNAGYLPDTFPAGRYSDDFLVILDDYKAHKEWFDEDSREKINERWTVLYSTPMVGTVIHEIGHTYFDLLSPEQKNGFFSLAHRIDTQNASSNNLPNKKCFNGHPSAYSYFYDIAGFDVEDAYGTVIEMSSEQYSEAFTYHVLGHTYMHRDKSFMEKLEWVVESLKPMEHAQLNRPLGLISR